MDYSKYDFYNSKNNSYCDNEKMSDIFKYIAKLNEEEGLIEFEKLCNEILSQKPNALYVIDDPMSRILIYEIQDLPIKFQEKFIEFYKLYKYDSFEKWNADFLSWKLDKIDREKLLQEIINIGGITLSKICSSAENVYNDETLKAFKDLYAGKDGKIPDFFAYKLFEDHDIKGRGFEYLLQNGLINPTKSLAKHIINFEYTGLDAQGKEIRIKNFNQWVLFYNLKLFQNLDTEVALAALNSEYSQMFLRNIKNYIPHFDIEEIKHNKDKNLMYKSFHVSEIFKFPSLISKIC